MPGWAPATLAEALELRAAHPEAVPVAGGTDLMVEVNLGHRPPPALLDLSRLEELQRIERPDGLVRIGAGVSFARIAAELGELAALAEAARGVGSRQIRSRATIGGNLQTASPAGDALPVLAAYDGRVVVASAAEGTRTVSWREFLVGPKRTSLGADELIVAVEFDAPDGPGSFAKVGPRSAMVIAVAGICLQLQEHRHGVSLALGSVGPTVLRAPQAERAAAALVGWSDPERAPSAAELDEFGTLAAAAASPIDDLRGSAAYRRHVVSVLSRRALTWALADRRAA